MSNFQVEYGVSSYSIKENTSRGLHSLHLLSLNSCHFDFSSLVKSTILHPNLVQLQPKSMTFFEFSTPPPQSKPLSSPSRTPAITFYLSCSFRSVPLQSTLLTADKVLLQKPQVFSHGRTRSEPASFLKSQILFLAVSLNLPFYTTVFSHPLRSPNDGLPSVL